MLAHTVELNKVPCRLGPERPVSPMGKTTLANWFERPGGESKVHGSWLESLEQPYSNRLIQGEEEMSAGNWNSGN